MLMDALDIVKDSKDAWVVLAIVLSVNTPMRLSKLKMQFMTTVSC